MKFKNIIGHFKTVTKHKWLVLKFCIKAGEPLRGILHDLSKYSPTEFIESAKFYQQEKRSPIAKVKEVKGYSEAWLHHRGRNRHHLEYWYDDYEKNPPIIPFPYCVEMVCDKLAAGMIYQKDNWNQEFELKYWNNRDESRKYANPKVQDFVTEVFTEIAQKGIDRTLIKKNLKRIYEKHCKNFNTEGENRK